MACTVSYTVGGTTTCATAPYRVVYTSSRGAGAAAAADRGPPGPRTRMGVVPEHLPGIHMGMATSSTTRCSVAMRWGHLG